MADEVKTSGGDLEKAPLDQVMQELGADAKTGLSASEAQARLQKYGANAWRKRKKASPTSWSMPSWGRLST